MTLPRGARLGPYEIGELIGRGGMGEVYRGLDTRLGRDVAIKILSPHLADDPASLMRFRREARAVAALSHPNIVAVFDVGAEGDTHFVVTELLEGETLRTKLAAAPLPVDESLRIATAIAAGLAAAHAKGIIHRDLKPENAGRRLDADGLARRLRLAVALAEPGTTDYAALRLFAARERVSIAFATSPTAEAEESPAVATLLKARDAWSQNDFATASRLL